MKKQLAEQHPILSQLSPRQRNELWHAYRAKYPNRRWEHTFFGLWLAWVLVFLVIAEIVEGLVTGFAARLIVHLFFSLGLGVVGGIMVIGSIMLPRRTAEFLGFLDGKSLAQARRTLDLSDPDGQGASDPS